MNLKTFKEGFPSIFGFPSVIGLILANLTVLAGTLFFGWDLLTMVLVYWLESAIIGFYTIIKMFVLEPFVMVIILPIYLFHFGIFLFVYLIFVYMAFGPEAGRHLQGMAFLKTLFLPLLNWTVLLSAAVPLFLSHGLSFVRNFWPRRIMYANKISDVSFEPYPRIMLMAPTLLLCALAVQYFAGGQVRFGCIPLIAVKTCADIWSHLKQNNLLPREWENSA